MNNNQLAEVAKILGVSEDIITAMYDEIKNSMTANLPSVPNRAVRPRTFSESHISVSSERK